LNRAARDPANLAASYGYDTDRTAWKSSGSCSVSTGFRKPPSRPAGAHGRARFLQFVIGDTRKTAVTPEKPE
jgi:hypothetical protein